METGSSAVRSAPVRGALPTCRAGPVPYTLAKALENVAGPVAIAQATGPLGAHVLARRPSVAWGAVAAAVPVGALAALALRVAGRRPAPGTLHHTARAGVPCKAHTPNGTLAALPVAMARGGARAGCGALRA